MRLLDIQSKRPKLRSALAFAVGLLCAGPSAAATLGYELTINNPVFNSANGNNNVPDFQLTNTSILGQDITGFDLTIGDTAFNYDFVRIQNAFVDPGADLSFTLNTVGTTNDGVGDDVLSYSFLGFNPGDVFRFEVDVDPDTGGPVADYRNALFPLGSVVVTFSDGTTLANDFSTIDSSQNTFTVADNTIAPVPLPGGLAMMLLAGLMGALAFGKRPLRFPRAVA